MIDSTMRTRPETIHGGATGHWFQQMAAAICLQVCLWLALCVQAEEPKLKHDDFVDLAEAIPSLIIDCPYAGSANFLKRQVYPTNTCYLRRAVAERLAKVQADLKQQGYGLKVYDGYRPLSVQKEMWKLMPDARYVADPAEGSRHNRGAAVDVTLVNAKSREVAMPTKFDDFSERAHTGAKADATAAEHRDILQKTMNRHGFVSLPTEWWHFDAPEWKSYPIEDVTFEELKKMKKAVPAAATGVPQK